MTAFSFSLIVIVFLSLSLASARPLSKRSQVSRHAVRIKTVLYSARSGHFVKVNASGNVTATGTSFHLARDTSHLYLLHLSVASQVFVFESAYFTGSFLHFEAELNGTVNATSNATDTALNATIVGLTLRMGSIAGSPSFLHSWTEEDGESGFVRYFVTITGDNGEDVKCYLAFESSGEPVEEPCMPNPDFKTLFLPIPILY